MSVNKIPIPGMLKSSIPDGHVVGAADVLDENLSKDQQAINAEIVKHIPLGAFLDISPTVEQTSLATHDDSYFYSYVWDAPASRLLLKVTDPNAAIEEAIKYYMSWNDKPTGMASSEVDLEKDFFFLAADEFLTIYHWKLVSSVGRLVPTGSGGSSSNNIMVVNASRPRIGSTTQYIFDCDKSVSTIYQHIAEGGMAIVKGSLAGTFQAILSGTSLVEGEYSISGITKISNVLYTLNITAPINSAPSTLYADQDLMKIYSALDREVTDNTNNIWELMTEVAKIKGASKFVPLATMLSTSPVVVSTPLTEMDDAHTYDYVWCIPRKKLYLRETANSGTPPAVTYYSSWTEDILGTASEFLNPTWCFFYTFGDNYLTIWHWKGNPSTGDLVPIGPQLSDRVGALEEDVIGINQTQNTHNGQINSLSATQELLLRFMHPVYAWGNDYQVYEDWEVGQLWYDDTQDLLYVCTNSDTQLEWDETEFEEGFYLDVQHGHVYQFGADGNLHRIGSE